MKLPELIIEANNETDRRIFNNAGQAWNHELYWEQFKPRGAKIPAGKLAEKINEAFGLGFEQLYCREDIFVFRPFADLKTEGVAPKSVLIDDLSPTETLARLKMKFLGINRRSYIQIRGFHGTDPATIDREIAEIVRKVRRFVIAGERAASKD